MPNFAKDDKVTMPAMRDVTMPNGDVVSFPADMPAARIQSLIAAKFPNEVQGLLEKRGKADNPLAALGKAIVGAPGNIAIGAQGVAQMLAEGEAGDPNSFAARIGPDFTLSERPGLDEVNFLQWGRAQLGLDMSTPLTDAQLKQIEELGRDEKSRDAFMRYARSDDAIGTSPQRVAAEAFKGARAREAIKTIIPEVHTVPGSVAGLVGNVGGSVTQMLPGYLASLLIRNPAPAVALAQTLTTGQSYVDARAAGIDPGKAARYAMENGLAEAVGEALPLGMILKEGGGKLLPRLFKAGASEALQEGVTQFIQSMLQSGLISPDMTWGQVRGQVVEAMVGGMASGVLLGGGVALADRLTRPTIEDVNDKVFPPGAATPADTAPAALAPLPPPEVQLALPSPEAYAAPDIVRRQPSAPEPVVEPGPAPEEIEQQAKDALKRTRQAETVALLQTARETVSPIGTFDATELPADVAIKVNTHRARSGRDIDAPITVEDMVRARVPQAQIDAAIVLRKPLTAGRQLTPRDVRNAARAKNIRIDGNFAELARRATGAANIDGMSQTQLSVLHDVVSGLPVHDAPVSVPIADTNPFTEKQYADAVAAVRRKGRYTLGAIKEGSGLKSDADARALRAAMVRRGQLVQRSANDYRLYDNLGVQTKPTAADLPNAAFVEHVVRQMPVGVVTVQRNGKSAGKFASQGEAADAVRRIRDEEAKAGVVGDKRAKIEIKPAGRVAYGVLENRYDEQGNFLGQAAVETYNDEAAARAAAAKLNDPARGATPRPENAAPPEKLPPGKFIIRKDGKPLVGLNTAAEVREELRRLREENRRLGLKEPDLAIERAPGVTEAAPIVPKAPRKPVAPKAIAGRVGEVVARLTELGNTRGLPLLGTKVRLTPVVTGKTGTPVEGVFSPVQRLIRLSLHNLRPDMTTDEVVDVLAGVMDHETIHALKTAGVLDPQSDAWKTLVRYASKTRKKSLTDRERQVLAQNKLSDTYLDVARFLYTGRPGYDTPADIEEEAIAEVFRHWAADRRNVTGKPATVLRQIVEWFKRLIRAVPEDLLRSIESGALVRKKFAPPGSDAPRARTAQEMAQAKAGMAAAQAAGDKPRAQADVRRYVRARDQAREDRYGRAGDKTVLGDTPSLSYAVGEAPDPDAAEAVLRRYGEVSGQPAPRLPAYLPEPVAFLKTLAVAQEKARHAPKDDAVARAYRALTAETRTMFDALGVKVELFSGPGEPYVSQRDMFDDVTTNKRVKLRLSTEQFGTSPENADHPMYAASGVTATDGTALTHNDLFRVVHEVYGHAPNGLRYQPRDAYNAYHAHRLLYSKDAIPALLTETLAQSAWQNYGAHMLRSDGTVPQTFDADYLPLDQRQYAKQKAYVLPDMVFEDPGVQAAAEAAQADALGPRTDVRESINSIEFQSWFGQSAVNENGVPTRVYHATSRVSFDEFDTTRSELGAHFGTLRQANAVGASKLNEQHADRARGRENDVGTHVYPVYLSIQRPLRLRDEGTFNNGAVADQLVDLGLLSEQEAEYLRAYGYQNRRALQDIIKSHGYDGAVYLNRLEGAPADTVPPSDKDLHELSDRMYRKKYPFARDSWIIFDPPQAKSAIANRGTYDRNNPDMRESLGNERFEAYAARAENELKPIEKTALPGIEHGLVGPVPAAVLAAREYAKSVGLPLRRQSSYVRVDVPRAKRIAQAYADMPHAPQDPAVRTAYQAMIEETIAQYKAVRATGLQVEAMKEGMEDPYPNGPRDVLRDIAKGHIWYFPTKFGFGSDALFDPRTNPLLAETNEVSDNGEPMLVNDLFRVVHDFFGHGLEGTGFGARGEENAWQSHVRLFSDRAVPAMTSETRGQNSWVNFGPFGERNRANPRDTVYADQKTGLMPEWTWREGIDDDRREVASGAPDVPAQTSDVDSFVTAFDKARAATPFGRMVHRYAEEDYAQMRLFLSPDGMSGFAIKYDNDIVSVFANPNGSRGRLPSIMAQAIANGGRKLDAFDAGLPAMYAKYGFVETGRMSWDDLYAPDGWDYEQFGRPDIVFMSYAGPEAQADADDTMRYSLGDKKLIDHVIGLRGKLRYLTEQEQELLTSRTAARFVSLFSSFPSAKEMAAVAFSGRAKRGWYRNTAEAIVDIFGIQDAPRFAALVAALSPQISVEDNAINALNVWMEWVRSNRTPDPEAILRILGRSVQGTRGDDSVLDAWKNNVVRALTTEDPATIVLSGPKVNSFAQNLRNVTNEVTNDAWMANYANVQQELFRAAYVKAPPEDPLGGDIGGKSPGYLAMSAVTRKAAEIATRLTGEQWTPAEIQETVWSWAKTLYEKAAAEGVTPKAILAAGKLTHADIGGTPDFATLFIGGVYRNILERGGYANAIRAVEDRVQAYDPAQVGGSPLEAEGSGLAQTDYDVALRRAAKRLTALLKARSAAKNAASKAHKEPKIAPAEPVPTLNEKDWDDKYSVTSPLFDETFGDRLPGGRLYGSNTIDPATAMSQPGVSPVALSAPVDGGQFFGGRLADAQLRMARDGIDGASMVYMRVEDFLRLAGDVVHPQQEVFNAAIDDGMKFNAMPSIWFDGNDGVVRVLAMDGDYAVRALAGRADRVPVIIQRKGNQYFGSLVGFETPNGTTAMPNGGLREFYPERRGERMSVGSEAFNKWFGDSKVVDADGRPLVVYKGHFSDSEDILGFFSNDSVVASRFANEFARMDPDVGAAITPVYLSLQKPFAIDAKGRFAGDVQYDSTSDGNTYDAFHSALADPNYDSVIITNTADEGDVYIAKKRTQVKSAIGNRGTWSAANPDIRESLNSPIGTRVNPQIDPDTYSVLHRDNVSWLGRQMVRLGRGDIGKADIPVIGETKLFRGLFGGSSLYEMRIANEDQYLSLFEMMERIRKEGGKITDEQNAYIAQQAAGSKATYRIQEHQRDIYDPLLAAIKAAHKAKKFTLKDYEKFLYARHAPERNAFLRARGSKEPNPSGMSEAEAAAIIDQFTKSGQLKDMLALDPLLARLRRSITDTRVSGGLLAPDAVSTVYEHWVPMQNGEDFDPFDTISRRSTFTGRGMSVAGRESRPVVGRGSKAGDLLSNMILQDTLAVVRSEHAAFNRKLVETIASNPALAQQDIEILSKPPLKTVVGSDGRIRTIVDPNFRSADNIYVTKIAGREVVMRVNNPWVSRALKGDFVHQTGPLVQSIGTVTRVLAAMRTTYNPTFVVTNLARDLQAAALNLTPQDIKGLSARMLAGVPRAGKAIGAYLISNDTSTEYGRYYEEMLTNGWTVSHMGLQTLETVVDRVRADAHSATGWRLTASQATKATRNIFGAIEATLSVAENGVRLSAYVEARRAGASIAQAGYLAKNLTVNFNKRGERSGAMNMLYMFYNAGVQGGAVLANMAKSKRGWKYLGAIVTTGFVLDMVNRMLSDDDNEDGVADYDQFSEYELSHNLIVPNPLATMGVAGQPKYLKFPMPLGYNAAHNLGRNISNMFTRKNKTWVDSLASIASGTADALNPIASGGNFLNFFAPTFADPFVDMAANTDYAGRAIIPERPSYGGVETPQSQLYWSSTDKSFVDIAAFLNSLTGGNEVRKGAIDWSPEALDYWTAFAAGGVGRFLLDMKYNITEGAPLLLAGKFDEIDTTRLPLINVVVGSNVDRAASSLYYEVNKEALTVEEEVNRFMERGEIARANAARTAHPVEFAMSSMFSGADKQIAGLRKQIRNIEAGRLPEEAKTKQIKLLREQIDTIMARALRTYYSAKDAVR